MLLRKMLFGMFALGLLLLARGGQATAEMRLVPTDVSTTIPPTVTIRFTPFGFEPQLVAIPTGTIIEWHNDTLSPQTLQSVQGDPFQTFLPTILRQGTLNTSTYTKSATIPAQNINNDTFSVTLQPGQSIRQYYTQPRSVPYQLTNQPVFNGQVDVIARPSNLRFLTIAEQAAPVGQTLTTHLLAVSSTNAPITFGVLPLPLPDNMLLDAATGILTFEPDDSQAGQTYQLQISATDGNHTASQSVTITVPELDTTADTTLSGILLDANEAYLGIYAPLVGATVTHMESGMSATTNAEGEFTLSNLSTGVNHIEYNASTVTPEAGFFSDKTKKITAD